jgi:UDP-N-acetylmuramoylalanine--D-glutamate ligase
MDSTFFKNKKITVFGLGLHGGGVGIVNYLAKHGARVIATDIKIKEQLAPSIQKLKDLKNVEYVLGQNRAEDFAKVDMVIKNPAASWKNSHIKLALENKIPVEMDSSLFFKLCPAPIIGITGTKGKTTTATLIFQILRSAGKNPIRVGVGQISVLDRLELFKKNSVAVFELSSWRLSALKKDKLSPQIAVITNIFEDHLNYYPSMKEYIEDKKNIFLFQKPTDWLVMNAENEIVSEISREAKAQIMTFSLEEPKKDHSIFVSENNIYINDGNDAKKVISLDEIKIPGTHNTANVMAAIGAVYAYGVDIKEIRKALAVCKGIEHRLEFVKEINGIRFYNDTAATVPQAAIKAIDCFKEPVVLIAGGEDKGLKFEELGKAISEKVKKLVLLKGSATEKLLGELKKNNFERLDEVRTVDSMEEAVAIANQIAEKGDAVVLSPGATSFNLFLNEFDRGDKFKEAVNELK